MITVALIYFFDLFVIAMNVLIVARIVASWVGPESGFYNLLFDLTEPILAPIRRLLPSAGMLDLSPMATLILLNILQQVMHALILRAI